MLDRCCMGGYQDGKRPANREVVSFRVRGFGASEPCGFGSTMGFVPAVEAVDGVPVLDRCCMRTGSGSSRKGGYGHDTLDTLVTVV